MVLKIFAVRASIAKVMLGSFSPILVLNILIGIPIIPTTFRGARGDSKVQFSMILGAPEPHLLNNRNGEIKNVDSERFVGYKTSNLI